jgi:Ca2+/Na+ antiporter
MLSQGVIADKFLMKSLENISSRYNLSQSIAGMLIAFGVAVPEVVVTILSFQRHGIKMTEFGMATILGSVCFATCFIPAAAHLATYGLQKPKPELTDQERESNQKLLQIFVRDMAFIIIGLALFYYFLSVGAIT